MTESEITMAAKVFVAMLPDNISPTKILDKIQDVGWNLSGKGREKVPDALVSRLLDATMSDGRFRRYDIPSAMKAYCKAHDLRMTNRDFQRQIAASLADQLKAHPLDSDIPGLVSKELSLIMWLEDVLRHDSHSRYNGTLNTIWRYAGERYDTGVTSKIYVKLLSEHITAAEALGEGIAKQIGVCSLLSIYSDDFRG